MKQRRPLRVRKPWQQKIGTYKPTAVENDRAASTGPHLLEQAKFEAVERSNGFCETPTPDCQPGPHRGHHAHHVQLRAQGIDHSAGNLLWCCGDAHRWIHGHPKESYANGWLAHPDRTVAQPGGSYMKARVLDPDADG